MELSNAAKMKAADRAAMGERGIDSLALMESAARAVAEAAADYMRPEGPGLFFCGTGNNGGDGIAAARLFHESTGRPARVFLVGAPDKLTDDALAMVERLQTAGLSLESFRPDDGTLSDLVGGAGVVVDALFGIGLSRPLRESALSAVRLINGADCPVVAADIASGVAADTGEVLGEAVRAACTVTFSRPKPGHFAEPGCVYRGELRVADIGLPEDLVRDSGCGVYAVREGELALPAREPLSHKGDYGKLLIVGGSVPYSGAPSLCARAAVRAGAGLVYLGVPEDIYEVSAVKNDEAMVFPLAADERGRVSAGAWGAVSERLDACGVCVVGPGLGRTRDTAALVARIVESASCPVVADADALWAIARNPSVLDRAAAPVILTPHEGEFARLTGRPVRARLTEALDYAERYGCAVVLKGHRTICAFPDSRAYIIDAGNPGMAKGGSGDALAGILGAMLGQLAPRRAVVTACWLHARAGDLAAEEYGQYALTASDLIGYLPRAERELQGMPDERGA